MDFNKKRIASQINLKKSVILKDDSEISLTKILGSEQCQDIIANCREFRERVYSPWDTLLMFIKQVLNADKSCKNIVTETIAKYIAEGKDAPSNNTGPYTKARERLPEKAVCELVEAVGVMAEEKVPRKLKWRGKNIKGTDGTTLLMPDTQKNQEVFPQHGQQKEGVGFPITRLVAIMSLTTGVILDYAMGPYQGKGTGESSLLREIFDNIQPDDVVLGDAYFPSYFFICDLLARGADGVFPGQAQRHYDFRTGESLGKRDHKVEWEKPRRPTWMNEEQYQQYPDRIQVREFKVNGKIYVTTFLNSKKFNKKELSGLYQLRWLLEINLRSVKTIMKMDMLSCKTPDMVRKEIGIHFLAYNIIRIIMAEACNQYSGIPNQISFKGTVQIINQFMPYFSNDGILNKLIFDNMLRLVVKNKIGNRPGRLEPRAVKRRRKPFPLLHVPRNIAKLKLEKKREKILLRKAA
jgi:hypothetical protein